MAELMAELFLHKRSAGNTHPVRNTLWQTNSN
jgi:hypothetical protein